MGKGRSPGKWFKNFILGRKSSSKSNSSKKKDIFKLNNNEVLGSSEISVSDPTVDSLVISAPISGANSINGVLSEKNKSSNERDILSTGGGESRVQADGAFRSQEDHENLKLTEAAIKVQAACRGYQARRTFQMLKGIIQLQALIRGRLVRKQAVAALYCVKGIVKFQALARGYIVRRSDIGLEVLKIRKDTQHSNSIQVATSTQAKKLPESVFVCKLLASSGSVVPSSLNCDPNEPNLGWKWLDSWTRLFWAPPQVVKKKFDPVSGEKGSSNQAVKRKQVKRTTQKSPTLKADDVTTSGANKYKQRPKKDLNSPSVSAQEHAQKEVEKNSSKKTRLPNVSDRSEAVTEKRKQSTKRSSEHTVADVSEQGLSASLEKRKDLALSKCKESDAKKNLGQPEKDNHDTEPNSLKKSCVENVVDRSESVIEEQKHCSIKVSDETVTDVSDPGTSASPENKKDLTVLESKGSDSEKCLGQKEDNEPHSPEKIVSQSAEDRSESVNHKRKNSTIEDSDHTVSDVLEQGTSATPEKKKDLAVSKESDPEKIIGQQEDKHVKGNSNPKKGHVQTVADSSEIVHEKRKNSTKKISDHTVADVSEQGTSASSEKKKALKVSKSKESDPAKSTGQTAGSKHDIEPHNDLIAVSQTTLTNGINAETQGTSEDLNGGDGYIGNNCQRRASLPANFSDQDSELHSTPRLPSYMAPTESAKAKLRPQGSPRFAADLLDKNAMTRRHSLSSSFNSKSGSFSPRAERLVALSSKGAIRSDRSLSSSRDVTDKVIQPQWRR
ncbi:IQ-domain [Stylosanthes scabra]|uniref:IQ-domain n=1 Tax=Stylosanthes scabra TaxID=79078 RepID=A0ABU6TA51_9FABA|nr:IQ-domain [Stylosanthes scabra]